MKIIAQNQTHRLIHISRAGILKVDDWRLQTWNGQDWAGSTQRFDNQKDALAAAKKAGLDVPGDEPR